MPRLLGGIALGLLALLALWLSRPALDSEAPAALADSAADPISAEDLASAPSTTTRATTESDRPFAPAASAEQGTNTSERRELLVEVFDADGGRVLDHGVKLEFRRLGNEASSPALLRYFPPVPAGAPERIVVPILDLEKAFARAKELARFGAFEVALVLNTPLVHCTEHVFRNLEIPSESIRLDIAAGGSVRVHAVDAIGAPIARPMYLRLHVAPLATGLDDDRAFERAPGRSAEVASGTHIFRDVLFPSVVEARVVDPTGVLDDRFVRALGPARPGDVISMTVRLDAEAPRVCGRMLDEKREPLRSQLLALHATTQRGVRSGPLQTDEEGRFSFPWPASARERGRADSFHFVVEKSTPSRSLTVFPPEIPAAGTLDLGDLVLRAASPQVLLAAGTVVDGAGRPLRGVSIDLSEVWPPTPTGPWEVDRMLGRSTDPSNSEGRFEVHGARSIRALRLEPRLLGHVAEASTVIQPGQMDLVLVMHAAASLSGSVLFDDAQHAERTWISMALQGRRAETRRADAEGRFTVGSLTSGRYTVRVQLDGLVLASIDEVEVISGTESRDPRLDPLDLRGTLRTWRLRLRDVAGGALPQLDVTMVPRGTSADVVCSRSDEEGLCSVAIPKAVESLRLFAAGRGSVEITWSAGEQVIALGERPVFRVRVTGLAHVPREYEVSVGLRAPHAERLDPLRTAAVAFDHPTPVEEGNELVHRVAWPGQYEHRWRLRSKRGLETYDIAAVPIDIGSEAPADPIEIAPPAADLAKAIAEMRRREGR